MLNNKTSLFVLLSFVTLICFGVDIAAHQTYNLSPLTIIENDLVMDQGFYAFDYSPLNPMYYYMRLILPILEYGAIFIALSFLVRLFTFILLYKILSHFLESNTAVLLTTIFLMAYLWASHGVIENGLWAAPVFFPAALSSLATLSGIHSFIKERYLLAGITFGISILFHSLYGISSLAFFFIAFIVILFKKNDGLFFRNFFVSILPILCSIFYLAYFRLNSNIDVELTHSIYDWFQYTSVPPSSNISILWAIYATGYCLVPIFITGFYLAWTEKKNSTLGLLTIWSIIMILLFTCVEIIHSNGILVDLFSELFIAAQMRRGTWVAVLFSLIQIAKVIFKHKEDIFKSKLNILLLIFATSAYIFPSIIAIISVYSVLFFILKNRISAVLFISAALMSGVYFYSIDFNLLQQLKTLSYSLIFTIGVIISMIVLRYRLSSLYRRFCIAIMFVIVMLFTSRGLYQKNLENNALILMSNGIFSKTNTNKLINFLDSGTQFDYKTNLCMKQSSLDSNDNKIQLPITGLRNTKLSLFSFKQMHGFYNPMYSRKDFQLSLNALKTFFGSDIVNNFFIDNNSYDKEKLRDFFLDAYFGITIQQLIHLRDNADLRFYVLESKSRTDLIHSLVCKGDKYYVYDMNLLWIQLPHRPQ